MVEVLSEVPQKRELWKITLALPVFDQNCGDVGTFIADDNVKAIQIYRAIKSRIPPRQNEIEDDYCGEDYV